MSASFGNLLYLVSGVLFILALRGLSSPASSRQGNMFGMIGMGLAIVDRIAQWHKAELKLETSETLGGLKISVIFARGKMFEKSE